MTRTTTVLTGALRGVASWFDNASAGDAATKADWPRAIPFVILHLGCLLVFLVGTTWTAVAVAAASLLLRAFFVTAFYHRYFSHRTFRTSRAAQLVFAVLGNSSVQRGPLWWAAHHRQHHRATDREGDPHSPITDSWLWSHIGWLLSGKNYATRHDLVPDLAKFPELRWLDRFDTLVPFLYAASLYALGEALRRLAPGLGTSGGQLVVWGFFVSTCLLFHMTSLVNSGAHTFGRQRFATGDESRNSAIVALLTLGEGWHNNHHHYPAAARQGFYWWEVDITYYVLKALAWTGLIRDLQPVPDHVLAEGRGRARRAA